MLAIIVLWCVLQEEDSNIAPETQEGATAFQFTAATTAPPQQFSFWSPDHALSLWTTPCSTEPCHVSWKSHQILTPTKPWIAALGTAAIRNWLCRSWTHCFWTAPCPSISSLVCISSSVKGSRWTNFNVFKHSTTLVCETVFITFLLQNWMKVLLFYVIFHSCVRFCFPLCFL